MRIALLKFLILFYILASGLVLLFPVDSTMEFTGWNIETMVFVSVSLQLSVALYAVLDAVQKDKDILSYQVILHAIFIGYTISPPVTLLFFRDQIASLGVLGFININYVFTVTNMMVLYQIGLILGAKLRVPQLRLLQTRFSINRMYPLGWLLMLLSLAPYIVLVMSGQWSIGADYSDTFEALSEQTKDSRIMLYLSFLMLLPVTWIILTSFHRKRLLPIATTLLIIVGVTMLKPSRGLLLSTMIIILLGHHYYRKPITMLKGIIALCLVFTLSYTIMDYRTGNEYSNEDIMMRASEGYTTFHNTYLVHQYVEETGDYRWGRGYLLGFANMIPQWLVPIEREQPLPNWLLDTFFPAGMPGGRMFSIVADGYLNFSYPGIILLGALTAYLMKLLYVSFRNSHKSTTEIQLGAILYFFLCAQVYYLIRGDLMSFLMRLYAYSLIPIVLLVIFTLRRKVRALVHAPDTGGTLP